MNRELKFRAWDKVRKEYYYLLLQHPTTGMEATLGSILNLEPWQQFTGLKDIIMKDVYEGDILDYSSEGFRSLLTIVWYDSKAGFAIENTDGSVTAFSVVEVVNEGRVIGSIWENPELLADSTDAKVKS